MIRVWIEESERTLTGWAYAMPPFCVISRTTVSMVESCELGSGGKGLEVEESVEEDFAATMTV